MASTYSSSLRFELPGIGEQANTWGTTLNTFMGTLLEQAISGYQVVSMPNSNYTLTTSNGATDQARSAVLELTGALTLPRDLVAPLKPKVYFVYNNTAQPVTIRAATGSGVQIPAAARRVVYCDGTTGFFDALNDLPSGTLIGGQVIATTTGTQTLTNKTLTTPRVGTAVLDSNGNEVIALTATASAVNEISIANSAAGNAVTIGAAGSDANISINLVPKGSGSVTWGGVQLVTTSGTQTLTNKTLTSPVISSISNTGTLTLPTSTDTLVGRSTTDTLTNKTLTNPSISSINNGGTITIPLGNLTLATLSGAETLSNKTLISPAISAISNGGTVTVPSGNLTLVSQTGAETLSNKTLSFPAISSINNGGTVTLPSGNVTLATQAGSETLSNKTIQSSSMSISSSSFTVFDSGNSSKTVQFSPVQVSGSTNRVMSIPDSDIVLGSHPITAITGNYTVVAGDRSDTLVVNAGGDITISLPVFANGFNFMVRVIAGRAFVNPTGGQISGGSQLILRTGEWAIIVSDGTNHQALHTGQITGAPSAREVGTRGVPVNDRNTSFTFSLDDAGSISRHTDGNGYTYTIPANSAVAFPIGTAITIVNEPGAATLNIACNDTLNRGDGVAGTGTRTVPANAVATVVKTSATTWMITGRFA